MEGATKLYDDCPKKKTPTVRGWLLTEVLNPEGWRETLGGSFSRIWGGCVKMLWGRDSIKALAGKASLGIKGK